jgi:hypothetical protein
LPRFHGKATSMSRTPCRKIRIFANTNPCSCVLVYERRGMTQRTKFVAVLVVAFASLIVLRSGDPVRMLPSPAQRFVRYYQAVGASEAKSGPLRRVLYSLAMASRVSRQPERVETMSRPHPWSDTVTF